MFNVLDYCAKCGRHNELAEITHDGAVVTLRCVSCGNIQQVQVFRRCNCGQKYHFAMENGCLSLKCAHGKCQVIFMKSVSQPLMVTILKNDLETWEAVYRHFESLSPQGMVPWA
jgi:hypothetical protein